MKLSLTCVNCPKGCNLLVEYDSVDDIHVTGNTCPKGKEFGVSEVLHPVRFLTTTVALSDGMSKLFHSERLPVISETRIPREDMVKVSLALKQVVISEPLSVGDRVASVMGYDFVASCSVDVKERSI